MRKLRCNPFVDAPITTLRVFWMAVSTIVFVIEVIYGTIRGVLWFGCGKNKNRERYKKYRSLMLSLLKLDIKLHPWLSYTINNPYREDFDKGAIAICNHQSLLDTLCVLILSTKLVIVANKKVIRNPLVWLLLYYADFGCTDGDIEKLKDYCKRQTALGHTVVIFPEGKRSEYCDILRFHTGAFHIAHELQLDIIPLFIHGSGHMLPLGKAFQNHTSLYVEIGKRIEHNKMNSNVREQTKQIRHMYEEHFENICKSRENSHYFHYLVVDLWDKAYKSRKKTKQLLKYYDDFTRWIDVQFDENTIVNIVDYTDGLFTLLFALVHPDIQIYCLESPILTMILAKYDNMPKNISVDVFDKSTYIIDKVCYIEDKVKIELYERTCT